MTTNSQLPNIVLHLKNELARLHLRSLELTAEQKQIEAEIARLNKMLDATK